MSKLLRTMENVAKSLFIVLHSFEFTSLIFKRYEYGPVWMTSLSPLFSCSETDHMQPDSVQNESQTFWVGAPQTDKLKTLELR